MKKTIYIICLLIISSCNYFEKKKIKISDELIQEKVNELDLSRVDKYPVFKECERLSGNIQEEKDCFISSFSEFLSEELSKHNLILLEEITTTIDIPIIISKDGEVLVNSLIISDSLKTAIPNLEYIIKESISKLPKIIQGYKKIEETGELVPVTTRFMIPIQISE